MTAIEEEVLDHESALIGHVHLAAHAHCEVLSTKTLDSAHVERFDPVLDLVSITSMRARMNCTVRFGKQFSESSPCLPWQQKTWQQGRYTN